MSTHWNSLYCPSEDAAAIAQSLRKSLADLGYDAFDPFGVIPGKSYGQTVRLFVAPPHGGWTRVLGLPEPEQLVLLSHLTPCFLVQLTHIQSHISVYVGGASVNPVDGLFPYLRTDCTKQDLKLALNTPAHSDHAGDQRESSVFDVLPDDVRGLAGQVDKHSAEKMFNRLSGQLMKKVGSQAEAAGMLLSQASAPDWGSVGGKQIRALMNCLIIPEDWQAPDFDALRDAYTLHVRRRRKPDARLYPGDEETMARVPNALDYTPIYGGRNS